MGVMTVLWASLEEDVSGKRLVKDDVINMRSIIWNGLHLLGFIDFSEIRAWTLPKKMCLHIKMLRTFRGLSGSLKPTLEPLVKHFAKSLGSQSSRDNAMENASNCFMWVLGRGIFSIISDNGKSSKSCGNSSGPEKSLSNHFSLLVLVISENINTVRNEVQDSMSEDLLNWEH